MRGYVAHLGSVGASALLAFGGPHTTVDTIMQVGVLRNNTSSYSKRSRNSSQASKRAIARSHKSQASSLGLSLGGWVVAWWRVLLMGAAMRGRQWQHVVKNLTIEIPASRCPHVPPMLLAAS